MYCEEKWGPLLHSFYSPASWEEGLKLTSGHISHSAVAYPPDGPNVCGGFGREGPKEELGEPTRREDWQHISQVNIRLRSGLDALPLGSISPGNLEGFSF